MIEANLHETPKYGGWVESKGPRYCPSIEDKVVRFKDKPSHQVGQLHCTVRHDNLQVAISNYASQSWHPGTAEKLGGKLVVENTASNHCCAFVSLA